MKDCRRILCFSGICRFRIDYSDYYAHSDRAISEYNFPRFPDTLGCLLSLSPCHYQNRLRHRDLEELFQGAGFEILENEPEQNADDRGEFEKVSLAAKYLSY